MPQSEEPLPSALLPIRDRFAALFQRARDDQNAGCQTDYVHAAIIADSNDEQCLGTAWATWRSAS
ncbi:aminoglycoside phosphotransferase family protein [Klebsiella pneumoniae]|uniref:aminoglycoside phosphotransferase family protein n=1 Tax=Klebsiella pneumoniae TaxID=573 RepID=UPI003AB94D94